MMHQKRTSAGKKFAMAGLTLGLFLTLLSLYAYTSKGFFPLDRVLPEFLNAYKLDFPTDPTARSSEINNAFKATLQRPSKSWGVLKNFNTNLEKEGDLILVNLREDAYLACMIERAINNEDENRDLATKRFFDSALIRWIGKAGEKYPPDNFALREVEGKDKNQEFYLDLTLGGWKRTFLFRLVQERNMLFVLVGGTRAAHFAALEASLRQSLQSFKTE